MSETRSVGTSSLGPGGFDALTQPTSHREYQYAGQGGLESVTELTGEQAAPLVTYELDGRAPDPRDLGEP